ncbi:MAG: 1-acyl-sn-glycerol-3-phosphate acyltransferase [Sphingobacterium sp.]|nr:1-acyl-sn-glycerol-3-phosphate acyltransferase [Sphingobacterium sp.]
MHEFLARLRSLLIWLVTLPVFVAACAAIWLGLVRPARPGLRARCSRAAAAPCSSSPASGSTSPAARTSSPAGQYVAVMNHVNFFDPMVFQVAFPYAARGVEEESHFRWPVYGATLKRMGMFPIDRKDSGQAIETMRRAADWLRRKPDFSFGVMPEGTRTLDGKLGPFKRGAFILAVESGLDILPIVQSGAYAIARKGSLNIRPGKVTVTIAPPVPSTGYSQETVGGARRTRPRRLSSNSSENRLPDRFRHRIRFLILNAILGLRRALVRKVHEGEALRDVRVVDPVPVQGPAGMGLDRRAAALQQLESREVHPPDVARARRHRPAPGEVLQAGPRKGDLGRPALIDVGRIVESPPDLDRRPQAGDVVVHESPTRPARVLAVAQAVLEAAEDVDLALQQVELGDVEPAALLQGVLPDVEDLVDRAQGVDLELVVAVLAADEDLDVVLGPDERVALRQLGPDIRSRSPRTRRRGYSSSQREAIRVSRKPGTPVTRSTKRGDLGASRQAGRSRRPSMAILCGARWHV